MSGDWRDDFAATPPFAHLTAWAGALAGAGWPALEQLDELARRAGVVNARGLSIRFQTQERRCGQVDYEAGILASGCVPTRRDNWHDLLNALIWLAFPRAKAALNAVQCRHLETGRERGRVADAATLFDESGLVLTGCDPALAELLAQRRWREAFVTHRRAWQDTRAFLIGHAVLEKLLAPWPGITAKCLFVPAPALPADAGAPAWLDEAVARVWLEGRVADPKQLFPLPVLGIPGWWAANEAPEFYDNRAVFRPPPP
ncbi:MAG: hypothetical protein FD187_1437 [bacterium]|nr:MAG: hypothetical protein FD142_2284 [bacterium]KAF0149078.1 MAG: hypothetical protein FD187_1437 [bacterium]KAF0168430.1 MAG: hypothetical protein FD158_1341 [bacterium]TXT20397.1 MAG: hypothetical protein FD132_1304 [bacterium]